MNPNKYLFLLLSFFCCLCKYKMQDKRAILKTNLEQFDCHSVNIDWPKAVRILLRNKSGLS
jgi:hypothetical protein